MDKEITVGHYASHHNTGRFNINKTDRVIMPEINEPPCCKPSDLELRIRKEVMGKISDLICLLDDCEERVDIGEISGCPWAAARFDTAVDVQNLLKLLWGEDK